MPILFSRSRIDYPVQIEKKTSGYDSYYDSRLIDRISELELARMNEYTTDPARRAELRRHFKSYPRVPRFALAPDLDQVTASFREAVIERRSRRKYSGRPLQLAEFSNLLTLSYQKMPQKGSPSHRTAPSGGSRFPGEIYAFVRRVDGIPPGIYHYNIHERALEQLSPEEPTPQLRQFDFGNIIAIEDASVVLVLTAVIARSTEKYGPRGWRLLFLDLGHLGQNLWLTASAIGLACVAMGGGQDRKILRALSLNEAQEIPILAYAVGGRL